MVDWLELHRSRIRSNALSRVVEGAVVSGGSASIRIEKGGDPSLRVPDIVLKSVAFIAEFAHEDSSGTTGNYVATGFFVCVPFANPALSHLRWGYFVTAAHVAQDLSDTAIYFAVNKKGGGLTGIEVQDKNWWIHQTDSAADVALVSIVLNREAEMMCVAIKDFVSEEDFASKRVGVGDEVFITGLFTAAPGVAQIMPIVRHGNISMLPTEQLQTERGITDVYLVEARSIGGLSGSPVFVRSSEASTEIGSAHGIKLLGLMHGHWDIRESELNESSIVHDRRRGVNLGIGIVVPAFKIIETINHPALVEWREIMEQEILKQIVPGTDSARSKKEEMPD